MKPLKQPLVFNQVSKIIVAFAIGLVILVAILGCSRDSVPPRSYYTVAEAWEKRDELKGEVITVRGYFGYLETAITLIGCQPKRCDCNTSRATRIGLFSEGVITQAERKRGVPPKYLILEIFDCKGDECVMTCRPINPEARDELEFVGVLRIAQEDTVYPYLMLDSVRIKDARWKINDVWQSIPTGAFQVELSQKR